MDISAKYSITTSAHGSLDSMERETVEWNYSGMMEL